MAKKKPPKPFTGVALKGGLLGVGGKSFQPNPGQPYDPISYGNFVTPNEPLAPLTEDPRNIAGWNPLPVDQVDVNAPDTAQTSATGQTTATFTQPPPPRTRKVAAHWFKPDWDALIKGDPRFIAGQSSLTANKASAATKRANAIKNAIIAFGGTPKNWASGYGDLNETDVAKAQENPYSFMALANAQRGRSRADLQAELAGRGMWSSGALTGGENMVQAGYDQGVAGGENSLLGVLGGAETGFGTDISGLDRDWLQTQAQIGAGVQAANPAQWIDEYEEPI